MTDLVILLEFVDIRNLNILCKLNVIEDSRIIPTNQKAFVIGVPSIHVTLASKPEVEGSNFRMMAIYLSLRMHRLWRLLKGKN